MHPVIAHTLPIGALLETYAAQGAYTDCYVAEIPRDVTLREFVEAFYTTPVFKLERLVLRLALSRPSTDAQAALLAAGSLNSFAIWSVEGRQHNQVMLVDFAGRTRSWLMTEAIGALSGGGTRLYFGSAVMPEKAAGGGRRRMGWKFRALLGFHKIYSQVLLFVARYQLASRDVPDAQDARN
jgi:hypothetical protein